MSDHRQRLVCACRRYAELRRFAAQRERFLESLDWTCLDRRTAVLRERTDALVASNLAQGELYLAFLKALVRDEQGRLDSQICDRNTRATARVGDQERALRKPMESRSCGSVLG